MRIFYFVLFFAILAGVLVFFSIPTLREIKRSKVIESEIASLETEAEKLSSENNFLREKIEYLKSDHYKESVAKDRLSLRNMGEKIVVVQPNAKVLGVETQESEESEAQRIQEQEYQESLPNYMKWWKAVSGE